jgi:two-component sensor histidine kinase
MDSRVRALYKIDARPQAPAQARRIIAEELSSRLPAGVVNDIKLMVSELVTNGVVHGGEDGDGDAPVMLELRMGGAVQCRVLDHGCGFAARVERARRRGWGLRVVEHLADRWGMECSSQRTEVWFERQCA